MPDLAKEGTGLMHQMRGMAIDICSADPWSITAPVPGADHGQVNGLTPLAVFILFEASMSDMCGLTMTWLLS